MCKMQVGGIPSKVLLLLPIILVFVGFSLNALMMLVTQKGIWPLMTSVSEPIWDGGSCKWVGYSPSTLWLWTTKFSPVL